MEETGFTMIPTRMLDDPFCKKILIMVDAFTVLPLQLIKYFIHLPFVRVQILTFAVLLDNLNPQQPNALLNPVFSFDRFSR